MEKRLLLAVVLMTVAILFTNILFPPPDPPEEPVVGDETPTSVRVEAPVTLPTPVRVPVAAAGDSIIVESDLYRYVFGTRGAALLRAELLPYPSYWVPDQPVQLIPEGTTDFLSYRLAIGSDTIDLRGLPYTVSPGQLRVGEEPESRTLEFGYADPDGFGITLRYLFDPRSHLFSATGRVDGLAGRPSVLLTEIGPGLEMHEHPDHHSERELAVVTRVAGSVDRMPFRRVDGRSSIASGLTWAGIKNKYFLAAIIGGEQTPLAGAILADLPDSIREGDGRDIVLPRVQLSPIVSIGADGAFAFQVYLGPQDYGQLASIGYDLEEVTPYGYRWLQPVIGPLAAAVLWVLNTLHDTLGIAYGWVLVIFGVMMRIVLWPLNAKAMRAQMKNMAVQPLFQEIREKYSNDPQKQQEAMVALYKEHGFNPLAGCFPLLIPFPVLITLFFVFQNTIAFRGAQFLWLPDLSLKDPLYILPIILVVSMFALQWVMAHLSGMEQNPQMKMMMYFMPIMMGFIFFMLPSGLNLYYAVTQVASIPQQMLIAGERRRAQEALKKSGGPKLSVSPPGTRKSKAKR